jgi:hypothetical protein
MNDKQVKRRAVRHMYAHTQADCLILQRYIYRIYRRSSELLLHDLFGEADS